MGVRRPTIIDWLDRDTYEERRGWHGGKRVYTDTEERRVAAIKRGMKRRDDYLQGAGQVQMHYSTKYPTDRLPSEWFINDVVRRKKLQSREVKKRKRGTDIVKRLLFPIQSIIKLGRIHQSADFIGKKYITGRTEPISFFSTGYYQWFKLYRMWLVSAETVEEAIRCLTEFWTTHPIPHVFRLDNAMTFRGARQLMAHLGRFLKFLLNLNITPLFTAPYQSYTNPHIEGNNSTFAQKVWARNTFTSVEEIDHECTRFNDENERFYQWKFKERLCAQGLRFLEANQDIALETLRSTRGKKVTFIRQVKRWAEEDNKHGVVLLNKFVSLPEQYNNQYVFTVISLETATLHVYSEHEGISTEIYTEPFPITW